MDQQRLFAAILLLAGCLVPMGFGEDAGERHFTARQVFDYEGVILFESDFARRGFDKFDLSQDGRYRLAGNDPGRLRIADAPGSDSLLKAVHFKVPKAPNSYRSEISLPSENGFNKRWYGVTLFVPDDWTIDPNNGADIVMQWHAVPGNSTPTHPNLAIAIQDSNWWIRQSFGSPQGGPTRKSVKLDSAMRPGRWVQWIVEARWSPRADGRVRIWKDGVVVFDAEGPNVYGTIGTDYTPYLKTGIYRPEWNLKSEAHKKRFAEEIPGVTTKEIYMSKVIVAEGDATFEDLSRLLSLQPKHEGGRDGIK